MASVEIPSIAYFKEVPDFGANITIRRLSQPVANPCHQRPVESLGIRAHGFARRHHDRRRVQKLGVICVALPVKFRASQHTCMAWQYGLGSGRS